MLGMRSVALALCLSTVAAAGTYDDGTGGACRQNAGDAACTGADCLDKFDVITSTSESSCMMICDVLEMSCTGYEAGQGSSTGRCEIWKVPIGGKYSGSSNKCYNRTDSPGASDGDLYLMFSAIVYGMNQTAVMGQSIAEQAVAAGLIKTALASVYTTALTASIGSTVTVVSDDIKLNFTGTGMDVGLIHNGANKRVPLRMFRMLYTGSSAPDTVVTSIKTAFQTALTNAISDLDAAGVLLNPTPTSIFISVSDRMFTTSMPTDDFMVTTTMMMGDDTTTPSQENVNAAGRASAVFAAFVASQALLAGLGI